MATAVLYARQSIGDENDSASVNDQLEACRRAAESKRLSVAGEFSDLNTSGSTYPSGAKEFAKGDKAWAAYRKGNKHVDTKPWRAGLEQALSSGADWLVCYDMTRLARATSGSYLDTYIRQRIEDAGMKLLTAHSGEVDFSKFDQVLVATVLSQVEAESKEKLRKRSLEAHKAIRAQGGSVGGRRVFGYRIAGKQRHEIIPEEAVVIKRAYALYSEVKSKNQVHRLLKEEGAPVQWDTVRRMLVNPLYAGLTKNNEGELIESVAYPPIIPRPEWFAAQHHQPRAGKDTKHRHYFKGICYCSECGRVMYFSRHPAKDAAYIFCANGRETLLASRSEGCKRSRIIEAFDAPPALRKVAYLGLADSLYPLSILAAAKMEREKAAARNVDDKRLLLHNQLSRLDGKEKEIQAQYLSDALGDAAYRDAQGAIKERRKELKGALMELGSSNPYEVEYNTASLRQRVVSRQLTELELEELLHVAILRVDMRPWEIAVTLYDKSTIVLPRVRIHNGRSAPSWFADLGNIHYFAASWYSSPSFRRLEGPRDEPITAGRSKLLAEIDGVKIYLVE